MSQFAKKAILGGAAAVGGLAGYTQGKFREEMKEPPTRKDQFGFGTEQRISQQDVLEMQGTKLDKLLSIGEINQEEYKRLYEILQQQIQKEKKQKGMLERAIDHQTNIPYHNFQTGQEEIMER